MTNYPSPRNVYREMVKDVDNENVKDVDDDVEPVEEEEEEEKYTLKIRSHHIQFNDKISLSLDFKTKLVRFVRENEENLFDMSDCTVTTETGLCVRADGEILNDGNKTKRSNPRSRLFVLKRPKELSNSEAFEILHEDRVNVFMKRCEDENWSIDTCLSSKAYKSSIGITELDKMTSSGSRKSTWSSKTFVMTKQVSLSRQEQDDNMPVPCVIRSRRLEKSVTNNVSSHANLYRSLTCVSSDNREISNSLTKSRENLLRQETKEEMCSEEKDCTTESEYVVVVRA